MADKISIKEVAKHAGVSIGTVSNVLNRPDIVSSTKRQLVEEAIQALGYIRNDAARQLKVGRSSTIGAVFIDISNPFYSEVYVGAEEVSTRNQQMLALTTTQGNLDQEKKQISLFQQQQVGGLLITPVESDLKHLEQLKNQGVPVVLIDHTDPLGRFSSVSADDTAGGRIATTYLLQQGRKRIAFLGANFHMHQVQGRLAGAQDAVRGFAEAKLEIFEAGQLNVVSARERVEEILSRPKAEWPDAIFCVNDLMAVGALQALAFENRVQVPQEIAIVGYDDIPFASSTVVPLTTVQRSASLIGKTAIELLEEELNTESFTPRHINFQPSLVVRQSA